MNEAEKISASAMVMPRPDGNSLALLAGRWNAGIDVTITNLAVVIRDGPGIPIVEPRRTWRDVYDETPPVLLGTRKFLS